MIGSGGLCGGFTNTYGGNQKDSNNNYTVKCTKTFLSVEPLLEDITTTEYWNDCIISKMADWVIVGAETGRRKNKVVPERSWIRSIAFDYEYEIPVFMKSSLADIWGEQLIQEFPEQLMRNK